MYEGRWRGGEWLFSKVNTKQHRAEDREHLCMICEAITYIIKIFVKKCSLLVTNKDTDNMSYQKLSWCEQIHLIQYNEYYNLKGINVTSNKLSIFLKSKQSITCITATTGQYIDRLGLFYKPYETETRQVRSVKTSVICEYIIISIKHVWSKIQEPISLFYTYDSCFHQNYL